MAKITTDDELLQCTGLLNKNAAGDIRIPGVGLLVWVASLGSEVLEFKSFLVVELIPGGVDSLSSF